MQGTSSLSVTGAGTHVFVDSNNAEDIKRLRGWVKKGKAWAMSMLAQMYRDGIGVKQSDKKTIEFYEVFVYIIYLAMLLMNCR